MNKMQRVWRFVMIHMNEKRFWPVLKVLGHGVHCPLVVRTHPCSPLTAFVVRLGSSEFMTGLQLSCSLLFDSVALSVAETPAPSQQVCSLVAWDAPLLSDISTETLAAALRPFKPWNRRRGRRAASPLLLPAKQCSLATVSWPAGGEVQWSTQITERCESQSSTCSSGLMALTFNTHSEQKRLTQTPLLKIWVPWIGCNLNRRRGCKCRKYWSRSKIKDSWFYVLLVFALLFVFVFLLLKNTFMWEH